MSGSLLDTARQVLREADPSGDLVRCEIADLLIGPDELAAVPDLVSAALERRTPSPDSAADDAARPEVAFLVDPVPILRLGAAVKPDVVAGLEKLFAVRQIVLDDGHAELHVSDAVLDDATERTRGVAAVVTLGGGTITDIGKVVAHRLAGPPHIAIQTAASVDGFTDNVSVILRNGVKRTIDSRWPDAVVADTTLIAQAPARMNRAGFGEINSMFTAPADWRLASLCGLDGDFHPGPLAILREVGQGIEDWSPGLAAADEFSTDRLTRALALRGIATGVSGSTACLSGVEHLISHMIDISQASRGAPIGLHGAQVGVGSVVAAVVWERLFARLDSAVAFEGKGSDLGATLPSDDAANAQVLAAFAHLDDTDALGTECWRDYQVKLAGYRKNLPLVTQLLQRWPEHRAELRALVREPAEIAAGLVTSRSAAEFDDLPDVSAELARWAVTHCALMRRRFTAVDLLTFLGGWQPADVDAVLARSHEVVREAHR